MSKYLVHTQQKAYKVADRAGVSHTTLYEILKRERGQCTREVKLENAKKIIALDPKLLTLEELGVP